MRELARCIVWAVGLGALALLLAAFGRVGLAQADGVLAWAVFLVYSPFYLLGHAFSSDAQGLSETGFNATVFAAQFAYFLLIVAAARFLHRRRARRRP
jgi:hypothetical protein